MFDHEFYPTPPELAKRLIDEEFFYSVRTVLDPSAGKGDLLKAINERFKSSYNHKTYDCYAVEVDPDLRAILKEKNYRLIGSDFLNFRTYNQFDLILMNPPFSCGEKHLLKALEMQKNGGKIRCILNAETIRNPYTNERKLLVQQLESYGAKIEYVKNAFSHAEVKTNVEVAIIKVDIPDNSGYESVLVEHLKKVELEEEQKQYAVGTAETSLDSRDFFQIIIDRYNTECRNAMTIIDEFQKLQPLISSSFDKENPVLFLTVNSRDVHNGYSLKNRALFQIRRKYWETLFQSKQFGEKMTEALRSKFMAKVEDLVFYEFSKENIMLLYDEMNAMLSKGIEKTIIDLFDEFSIKGYWDENSSNIHYFNGWKTNKAYIVNKKVIRRLNGMSYFGERWEIRYETRGTLEDMEKVFEYLNPVKEEYETIEQVISRYEREKKSTQIIEFHYFKCQFYKKGTCHITFTDEELLKKFNLYGCIHKNWLFDSYGKKAYSDMTAEEKKVVDEFEGEKEYNKTLANSGFYLSNSGDMLPQIDMKGVS